jgi:hypothetical protein
MSNLQNILPTENTPKTQVFSSSGTFTVPNDVYTLIVSMVAAGGGGTNVAGGTSNIKIYGGGGGGGYYQEYPLAVTPGDVLTITIGAGGTSSYSSSTNVVTGTLTSGGNTSIYKGAQELLTAYGGSSGEPFSSYYYSNADSAPGWFGGGCGGAPNGSGGGGAVFAAGYGANAACAGGDCGARTSGSLTGGGPIRTSDYFGTIFGYGEFANGGSYGGSSPFPAGHGATSSASLPPGENGLAVLTWFE